MAAAVVVLTQDGVRFPVSAAALRRSGLLRGVAEDVVGEGGVVPVPGVAADAMALVLDPGALREAPDAVLLRVAAAAHFMDCEDVTREAVAELAVRLAGLSCAEMREVLGVRDDFSEAERRDNLREYGWTGRL